MVAAKLDKRDPALDNLTRDIVLMKDRETCWYVCTGLNKRLQPQTFFIIENYLCAASTLRDDHGALNI